MTPASQPSQRSTEPPPHDHAPWLEVTVTVPQAIAEDLAGLLLHEGHATGVELREREAYQPPPSAQQAYDTTLVITFDTPTPAGTETAKQALLTLLHTFGAGQAATTIETKVRDDHAWAHAWKAHFVPLAITPTLWVVPSWQKAEGLQHLGGKRATVLRLDPGLAFGTGQHATTHLCLQALEGLLASDSPAATPPTTMLDVGCGSGILTMAALMLGVNTALAIDNDPGAISATTANLTLNQLQERAVVSRAPLESLPPKTKYPLVVANILFPVLQAMCPVLPTRMAPGGTLLLSGILEEETDTLAQLYTQTHPNLRVVQQTRRDGWAALLLRDASS